MIEKEPTPIYWRDPQATHNGKPGYWDGESAIILRFDGTEPPEMLIPSDHVVPETMSTYRGPNFTAEDLDRKCSEMEALNAYYRDAV